MPVKYLLVPVLGVAVMSSAFGVIYAKHQNRMYFFQLQALKDERDRMDVEWGQLQLEQSTLITHGRIERMARSDLKMTIPPANTVVMIRP
ncbi:MAG: cell division protein FtsL [Gammaproteobacteria bacterium]|nr:cell division protein FtsL [Gammaproteobacteria bacterium]